MAGKFQPPLVGQLDGRTAIPADGEGKDAVLAYMIENHAGDFSDAAWVSEYHGSYWSCEVASTGGTQPDAITNQ